MNSLKALPVIIPAIACAAMTSDPCIFVFDTAGDQTIRRTDPGADGALNPNSVLPDVIEMSACTWRAFNPSTDPYTGQTEDPQSAHLFRVDVVFNGLVNPPGKVLGGSPDPFAFGPSPVIGFLDIDVDHHDSGGELGTAAEARYLANVGRFGRIPDSSAGERAARGGDDIDNQFYTGPQYERTGADFALVLCGCSQPMIVSEGGDGDGLFEEDETWIIRGRFFERTQGYREASAAFGGSAPGLYDPQIDVRFSHSSATNRTTVTVVWAIDMAGAAMLTGQPEQQLDLNVANHTSLVEALQDIIDGADIGGFSGPGWILVERWEDRDVDDGLEFDEWELTGLFGLPYADASEGLYVWTDTASSDEYAGDCNGDGFVTTADEAVVRNVVYANDGTANDADGIVNGVWTLTNPGFNFSVYDLNGSMTVETTDLSVLRSLGDFNWDGIVNTQDFIAYLNAWVAGQPTADFNFDGRVDTLDFVAYLNAWVAG